MKNKKIFAVFAVAAVVAACIIGWYVFKTQQNKNTVTFEFSNVADTGSQQGDNEKPGTADSSGAGQENQAGKGSNAYAVSSSNDMATDVAMQVLESGGNGVDAAIALGYTLAVTEPFASGIGGSGTMIVYDMNTETCVYYDYRAAAGSSASYNAIGIPGFVAGMQAIHDDYGTIDMSDLIAPAVYYAENGITVYEHLGNRLQMAASELQGYSQMYNEDGVYLSTGDTMYQLDLAATLKLIQENGTAGFYEGTVAADIAAATNLTLDDLKNYQVYKREAVQGTYHGYAVYSSGAPFSGITLIQMLEMSEADGIPDAAEDTTGYLSELSKITQLAISDRYHNIADPSMYEIDQQEMVSGEYIQQLLGNHSEENQDDEESIETTSFSVVDYKNGLVVACTNTLSQFWGSRTLVDGIWLNNSNHNFTSGTINKFEPGKRSRTYTSPTIFVKEDYVMAIGTPGGNNIPGILFQVINNILVNGEDPQTAVDQNRIVYRSGAIYIESGDRDTSWYDFSSISGDVIWKNSGYWWGSVEITGYSEESGAFAAYDTRRGATYAGVYNPE